MKELITVEQLSAYLHKSVASIRSDATRNPQSLPPICRLPATKRLLWRVEDVERWLASHVEGASPPTALDVNESPRPRRGRPTKAEQVARHRRRAAQQVGQPQSAVTVTDIAR
ncbi:hypothetical protein C6Q15_33135 [Burkholderia multivorans]|uniref:Uncharacterized protein n=1 Tax=Burkholderia multivorans TaxID=87883 RepID=A0A2S9M652_9BURK|nr:hypothetical protein C6Q07_26625 [Burkholderia multivorans]PRF52014.1 hypothetical protein C6Q15_33135 [Burkholderia multivorans]